jgi:putative flippase GtrA
MGLQSLVHKLWSNQLFRFFVVGGINTIFGYSMYALFTLIGLHYTVVVLLSQISGILFNFNTTGKIVFNNAKSGLLFRFAGIYVVMYVVNVLFLKLFAQIHYNMYFAGAILILPMAFLSFLLSKTFVFSNTH